jgi:NADH-quinone oxidoreductase subunit L
MPVTYGTFLVAAVAISGIPPLSGFFSKDEILWFSYTNIGFIVWIVGVITALFTAFYMFRLYFMTFEGREKFDHHKVHPHESPKIMTVPLIILAVLSALGGFIGVPEIFSGEHGNLFHSWLAPVFISAERKLLHFGTHNHFEELLLMAISVAGAIAAIFFARYIYLKKPEIATNISNKLKGVYNLLLNKYFVDEIYDATVVNPIVKGSQNILWKITDNKLIDGFINTTASFIQKTGEKIRRIQTGVAQAYALVMIVGILLAIMWIILSV